jgi:hypothetical protein
VTSLNDIAPWPRTEAEATADAVAKSLTVGAHARDRYIQTLNTTDKEWGTQVGLLVNEFGVVYLLKFLADFHPDVADDAARLLWSHWEDGGVIPELLWGWLSKWGIDPDQVAEVAERQRAEHAAKQAVA